MPNNKITIKRLKISHLKSLNKVDLSGVYSDSPISTLLFDSIKYAVNEVRKWDSAAPIAPLKVGMTTKKGKSRMDQIIKKSCITKADSLVSTPKRTVSCQTEGNKIVLPSPTMKTPLVETSWRAVGESTSFQCLLPSGRTVSQDCWFTMITSSGGMELTVNDTVLIDGKTVGRILGFWERGDGLMATVLLYQEGSSPEMIDGGMKDQDVPVNRISGKCAVLNFREYNRYRAALMRKEIGVDKYNCYGNSLLVNNTASIERSLLDCSKCRPKSFLVYGFRLQ